MHPVERQHIRMQIPVIETERLRLRGHRLDDFGDVDGKDKQTENFLGEVGFADYERDLKPSLKGIPEIGWVLSTQAHDRGYATEAVHAVVAWGDIHFGANKTACIIAPRSEEHTSELQSLRHLVCR